MQYVSLREQTGLFYYCLHLLGMSGRSTEINIKGILRILVCYVKQFLTWVYQFDDMKLKKTTSDTQLPMVMIENKTYFVEFEFEFRRNEEAGRIWSSELDVFHLSTDLYEENNLKFRPPSKSLTCLEIISFLDFLLMTLGAKAVS